MKNIYTIIGVVGILIVSVGAYFISTSPSTPSLSAILGNEQSLIDFVPGELGQVLLLTADEDLKQVAQATNSFDAEAFATTFESIEEIIVYQNLQTEQPVNLLFIQGNDAFDIATLEQLGLIAEGEDFEARELSQNTIVYSDIAGLDWYDTHTTRLVDQEVTEQFLSAYRKGDYNAGFFSTPEGVEQLGGYSALVAGNLESTYLLSSLNSEAPQGQLILQMKEDAIAPAQGDFEPKLQNYYAGSLFYLELQAIKDFLGIDESQIQTFLPFVAGSAGIPIPSPDGITELLGDNLAIVLQPSVTSPLGLQASLIVDGNEHFETLKVLYPVLQDLITQNLPLIASGVTLETIETQTSITTLLPVGEVSLPILSLGTDAETTQLTLLGSLTSPQLQNTDSVSIQDNTIAVFGRDSSLLGQLVGGALPVGVQSGILEGSITVDDSQDQIIVSFLQTNADE